MTYQRTGGEFAIMRLTIIALGACAVLASAPVSAQSPGTPGVQEPSGTQLTLEGLEKLMQGLQRMVEELPRYNLPEINENGDIIVRRIDPHGHEKQEQPMPPMSPEKGVDL
jgi:hypothetical protein